MKKKSRGVFLKEKVFDCIIDIEAADNESALEKASELRVSDVEPNVIKTQDVYVLDENGNKIEKIED